MAITVKCGNTTQGTGTIRATIDACHIEADGLAVNNADGTQKRYRLRVTPPAAAVNQIGSGYSELFAPSQDGKHQWEGYIFPASGSWSVRVYDEELSTNVQTLAVTVV